MKIVTAFLFFALHTSMGAAVSGQLKRAKQSPPKDKIRAVKTIGGRTLGFETGDYQHVQIRLANGKRRSFFLGKPGLDYFLATNKSRPIQFTYQVVDSYIPESGGVMRIERLVSAKVGALTFESWWRQLTSKHTLDEIDKRYGPLVQKYQLN